LLSLLRRPAYRCVAGLEISDDDYPIALELLKTRFGKTQQIQSSLHSKLNNLCPAGEDTQSQRRTLEEVEKCCRQLEALGENIENTQIALLIVSKFPESIVLKLHSDQSVSEPWRVNEIRKRLEEIIAHKEEVQLFIKNLSSKRLNNDEVTAAKTFAAIRPPSFKGTKPTLFK
uniref:DNA-directed RNA polymerase III subunit RPC9 n=1 Tax=Gongylonema pulchrum TaxID=637853 RepID=A0A183EZR2_9BILA